MAGCFIDISEGFTMALLKSTILGVTQGTDHYGKVEFLASGGLLILITLFAGIIPLSKPIVHLQGSVDYNTYECAGSGPDTQVFSVYALSYRTGKFLADSLCADARISKRAGKVKAQWRHQNITDLDILQRGQYDLLVAHKSHIERPEVRGISGYELVASYEPYMSYFITAQGDKPELTTRYFAGKRLGLIDSPLSKSGYLFPMQALRNAGVDVHLIDINNIYKSHPELKTALISGEVDIIGSYWSEENINKHGDLPVVQLKEAQPTRWYILPANNDTVCAVTEALKNLASSAKTRYFKKLSIEPVCHLEAQ